MEKVSDITLVSPSQRRRDSQLHVIVVNYFYEADLLTPDDLLDRYSTIRPIARALHNEGVEVDVLQRFHRDTIFDEDGVGFNFVADGFDPDLRKWQIPTSFHKAVRGVCAHREASRIALHIHGLFYPLQAISLRRMIPPDCAIVVQHHAERPWKIIRRPLQKWGLRSVDGFFFAARGLADCWIEYGIVAGWQQVYEVMEGSTCFQRRDRVAARSRTGLRGTPTILWVGNLTANKDPLTVLAGFDRVLQQVPEARLYMAYRSTDLLGQVHRLIDSSPRLRNAVTLLGNVPHPELEDIYNSADYFVLGSHYEGSGFALAEAMACGVVPVVTAIPSFLAMTDHGHVGACWAPGDSHSFCGAFLRILAQSIEDLSKQTASCFDRRLSYQAIARASVHAYSELVSGRKATKI
jgi:glycosyltransferase involved in cell wall biosynthesis